MNDRDESSELQAWIDRLAIVIDLQGADQAQATSTIHEMGRGASPSPDGSETDLWLNWSHYGIYYDDIVKIDGEWKFARRFCQPLLYVGEDAVPGDAIASRTQLVRTPTFPPPP